MNGAQDQQAQPVQLNVHRSDHSAASLSVFSAIIFPSCIQPPLLIIRMNFPAVNLRPKHTKIPPISERDLWRLKKDSKRKWGCFLESTKAKNVDFSRVF